MGLFDSFSSAFSGDIFESFSGIFEGDFDFENILGTVLPGSGAITDQFKDAGGGLGDLFSGDSGGFFNTVKDLAGGSGANAVSPGPARGVSSAPVRLTPLQMLSRNMAPQTNYRSIQQRAIYSPVNQSANNQDCLSVLNFVDEGFPSDQIPLSTRQRCRSWLTALTTSYSSGFQNIRPPSFPTPTPYTPQRVAYQPSLPRWAQAR